MNENQNTNNSNNHTNDYNQLYGNQSMPPNQQQPVQTVDNGDQPNYQNNPIDQQPQQLDSNIQPNYQNTSTVQPVQLDSTIINTPIIFEEEQPQAEVVVDVIPTFDTSVLEELPDDLKPAGTEEPLINSINKETQKEKEQHKRNMIFIAILFAVLIFAVVVIFPMLLDI